MRVDTLDNLYTPEDLERWRKGAEEFRMFFDTLPPEEQEELHFPRSQLSRGSIPIGVQGLFLGERALVAEEYSDSLRQQFETHGFKTHPDGVYNEAAVMQTIAKYPEAFEKIPHATAKECIDHILQDSEKVDDDSVQALGLLLGYPPTATKRYEKEQRQHERAISRFQELWNGLDGEVRRAYVARHGEGPDRPSPFFSFFIEELQKKPITLDVKDDEVEFLLESAKALSNKRRFGAYNQNWSDEKDNPDSRMAEERVRASYEMSGILEVKRTLPKPVTSLAHQFGRSIRSIFIT